MRVTPKGIPVLIGGHPRSNMTWLFNAVRLLYEKAYGEEQIYSGETDTHGAGLYDPTYPARYHVVKSYTAYSPLLLGAREIFTSVRTDREGMEKSLDDFLYEMTGVREDISRNRIRLWQHQIAKMEGRHTHTFRMYFAESILYPEHTYGLLTNAIKLPLTAAQIDEVWAELSTIKPPPRDDDGRPVQDPVTLLWSHSWENLHGPEVHVEPEPAAPIDPKEVIETTFSGEDQYKEPEDDEERPVDSE